MTKNIFLLMIFSFFSLQVSAGHLFYIGSYTHPDILAHIPDQESRGEGISLVKIDDDWNFEIIETTFTLNPAVLLFHPQENILYALSESIDRRGLINVFTFDEQGILTPKQLFQASGMSTCFLGISPNKPFAVISNYWDSRIDLVELRQNGFLEKHVQTFVQSKRPLDQIHQVKTKEEHWANRQVGPHAHSVYFWQGKIFIANLGDDAIFQYSLDENQELLEEACIELENGSGPRHMAFHPTLEKVYISNELASTVAICDLDSTNLEEQKARLIPSAYVSTLSEELEEGKKNYVSEIVVSSDGRFLYVSNRGHNSIAVFSIDQESGVPSLIQNAPTNGSFPRHFALSPDGSFMLVANQDSNEIIVLRIDQVSGKLSDANKSLSIGLPNYIKFLH